jgi:hypothetical protein
MKNASEMRNKLSTLFDDLRTGSVDRKDVKELTNICGKMISSAAAQVKYSSERKEIPQIAFLDEPKS